MQRTARREVKAQGTMGTEKARKEGMISQSYPLPSLLTHQPRAPRFAPCGALYEDDRRRIIHNALNSTTQVEFSRKTLCLTKFFLFLFKIPIISNNSRSTWRKYHIWSCVLCAFEKDLEYFKSQSSYYTTKVSRVSTRRWHCSRDPQFPFVNWKNVY